MKTIQEIFNLMIKEDLYWPQGSGAHIDKVRMPYPYMCISLDKAKRLEIISKEECQRAREEIFYYMRELLPDVDLLKSPAMGHVLGCVTDEIDADLLYTPEKGLALYSDWENRPRTVEEVAAFLGVEE